MNDMNEMSRMISDPIQIEVHGQTQAQVQVPNKGSEQPLAKPPLMEAPLYDPRFRRYMELTNEQRALNKRLADIRNELAPIRAELLPMVQSVDQGCVSYIPTNEDDYKIFGDASTVRVSVEKKAAPLNALSLIDLSQRYFATRIDNIPPESASIIGQDLAKFIWNNRVRTSVTKMERVFPPPPNASKRKPVDGEPVPLSTNPQAVAKRFLLTPQTDEDIERLEHTGNDVICQLVDAVLDDMEEAQ